jgi:hypothetical protein
MFLVKMSHPLSRYSTGTTGSNRSGIRLQDTINHTCTTSTGTTGSSFGYATCHLPLITHHVIAV